MKPDTTIYDLIEHVKFLKNAFQSKKHVDYRISLKWPDGISTCIRKQPDVRRFYSVYTAEKRI